MQTAPKKRRGSATLRLEAMKIVSVNEPSGALVAQHFAMLFRDEIREFLRKREEKKAQDIRRRKGSSKKKRLRKSVKKMKKLTQ